MDYLSGHDGNQSLAVEQRGLCGGSVLRHHTGRGAGRHGYLDLSVPLRLRVVPSCSRGLRRQGSFRRSAELCRIESGYESRHPRHSAPPSPDSLRFRPLRFPFRTRTRRALCPGLRTGACAALSAITRSDRRNACRLAGRDPSDPPPELEHFKKNGSHKETRKSQKTNCFPWQILTLLCAPCVQSRL